MSPEPKTQGIIFSSMVAIFFNFNGAFAAGADLWNTVPDNIDQDPARIWSWTHPEFLPFDLKRQAQSAAPAAASQFDPSKLKIDMTISGAMHFDQKEHMLTIPIEIKNNSPYEFSSKGPNPVNIGVHLVSSSGVMLNVNFYRHSIGDLPPNSQKDYTLSIPSNQLDGNKIEVMPVKEGVAWFSSLGVMSLVVGPFSKCSDKGEDEFCMQNQPIH